MKLFYLSLSLSLANEKKRKNYDIRAWWISVSDFNFRPHLPPLLSESGIHHKENEEEATVEELLPQPKARISRKTDKGKKAWW